MEKVFDLTPAAIIRTWTCANPSTAAWPPTAIMGREDLGVRWENTDRTEALKAALASL